MNVGRHPVRFAFTNRFGAMHICLLALAMYAGLLACLKCAKFWQLIDQSSVSTPVSSVVHASTRNFDFIPDGKLYIGPFCPDSLLQAGDFSISSHTSLSLFCTDTSGCLYYDFSDYRWWCWRCKPWVVKCCRMWLGGWTASTSSWYSYQRAAYRILSPVLMCLIILSTGYSTPSVPSLRDSLVQGGPCIFWGMFFLSVSLFASVSFSGMVTRSENTGPWMPSLSPVTIFSVLEIFGTVRRFSTALSSAARGRDKPLTWAVLTGHRKTRLGPVKGLGGSELSCKVAVSTRFGVLKCLVNKCLEPGEFSQEVLVKSVGIGRCRHIGRYQQLWLRHARTRRMTRQHEPELLCSSWNMHLRVIGVRQWLNTLIAIGLMFDHVAAEQGNNRPVRLL